jgi:hypothetical protein
MNGALIALIVVAALLAGYVLVRGILLMASGKDVTGAQSNKLMTLRVGFQALAILLVVILFLFSGRGAG